MGRPKSIAKLNGDHGLDFPPLDQPLIVQTIQWTAE